MARIKFTAPKVQGFACPADKPQGFLWDSSAPGLGLRVTPAGRPSYVFQSRFEGQALRVTIGSPDAWSIPQAQDRARELQRQIDEGRDPREVKAEATAADVAKRTAVQAEGLTVAEVWPRYMAEGKPKRRAAWKPRYVVDLKRAARRTAPRAGRAQQHHRSVRCGRFVGGDLRAVLHREIKWLQRGSREN